MAVANRIAALPPAIAGRPRAVSVVILAASFALSAIPAAAEPAPSSFVTRFAAVEGEPAKDDLPPASLAAAPKPSNVAAVTPAVSGAALYRPIIEKEAAQAGLAPEIAEAVMGVESGYNPAAIGGVGEIGLMQILPSTARMLGFAGTLAELAVPETNIHYGVTYLAQAWRRAGGDLCTAAMKYRAGHGETRFSVLSVNYCLAVRSKLAARGYRVTGSVPVATFGDPGSGPGPGRGCGRKCLALSRTATVNIAALNTQLSALVLQVRARR
ncbi:soluble lytic murein transglycosylase-like protein [Rhodopseudomonas rhenobacensis]|uniref:Soluble lytic murein transglycosylase-like protein n=1 Tax=Rhodopseudomonas rhenobacensis TaxID=87461 RepID=A0A7W7Z5C0_9BRAD|nr:transglycosylase SLT domain-containing protein [Rhodopseudomonas rhenobacensis]MBB5048296.1 soluble lytic murein transglycosylase-like protein [Rhodopseudomonas rhenobacensis]